MRGCLTARPGRRPAGRREALAKRGLEMLVLAQANATQAFLAFRVRERWEEADGARAAAGSARAAGARRWSEGGSGARQAFSLRRGCLQCSPPQTASAHSLCVWPRPRAA